MTKTWKQHRISHHKFMYEDKAKRFAGHHDDRQLFINTYNMILEALESLDDEPTTLVKVAMNHQISSEYEVMDEIIERFKPE